VSPPRRGWLWQFDRLMQVGTVLWVLGRLIALPLEDGLSRQALLVVSPFPVAAAIYLFLSRNPDSAHSGGSRWPETPP
jgi:hypothetical protein